MLLNVDYTLLTALVLPLNNYSEVDLILLIIDDFMITSYKEKLPTSIFP